MSSDTNILKCMERRGVFSSGGDIRQQLQRALTLNKGREDPLFARSLCHEAIEAFWEAKCLEYGTRGAMPAFDQRTIGLSKTARVCARRVGEAAAQCPLPAGAYYLSSLYVQALPELLRAQFGMFFTPPPLVERLLDMVQEAGHDWREGAVIDPACGGGAFLAPVARRMITTCLSDAPRRLSREALAEDVLHRIRGIEIESYCAWMSVVFLRLTLMELLDVEDADVDGVVSNADTMRADQEISGGFDLVIGNPPYGRITLPGSLRSKYERSLFGHANLYGIFTHIAVNLARTDGFIAYVTPTSFLGGQYFRNLRKLLKAEAPLRTIDFIVQRGGVFEGVLQETALALFCRTGERKKVRVHITTSKGIDADAHVLSLGSFRINGAEDAPWVLPREKHHADLLRKAERMKLRLGDLGFEVSTGPLVWNRHKDQMSEQRTPDAFPLIWAESVQTDGSFKFAHAKRNHVPYFRIRPGQNHLLTSKGCVLVQRTTAKEQQRRIIAARLPDRFVRKYGGAVIENHLNFVRPSNGQSMISLQALVALLNSAAIDQIFRCISGSVAVSAYEIRSMPLPAEKELLALQKLVKANASVPRINTFISSLYGLQQ